jgi:uroporphyrin-III C-methyltransferase/precorrin-2 dehydrogenase/sirohydrochlorin ferrochelatase
MSELLPLFVDLAGRRVLLVGGGPVAAAKLGQLLAARADVRVVAIEIGEAIEQAGVPVERRAFAPADLDGVWLVVAAATPDANRQVAAAAESRQVFVNAVDDPAHASAFLSGVIRRDGVTLAISTSGAAPGLTALMREGLDAVLPRDLGRWLDEARRQRAAWRRDGVPMRERRPLLLEALNTLYKREDRRTEVLRYEGVPVSQNSPVPVAQDSPVPVAQDSPVPVAQDSPVPVAQDFSLAPSNPVAQDFRPAQSTPSNPGHVSLVGAGPGDPGLLTRRAVARLRAADLVLYDALIDRRILKLARHAQRFFVGKRAGRHAMTQHTINRLMVRAARRGKRVVRLKGGDPFVFGRGGEEALALRAAGVSHDVVPGVTSAVAAPALAGIPVTHRGMASAFLVVGGHDLEAFATTVELVPANGMTIVVLMGVAGRAALASRLIGRGWAPRTPAAIVLDASKPTQMMWRGTLGELAADQAEIETQAPGTIVIGEVVSLAVEASNEESIASGTRRASSDELRAHTSS